MTADQRRQAIADMLDKKPDMSQHAIAKVLGCSQKTVSRDMVALGLVSANQFTTKGAGKPAPQAVPLQVNGGVTRSDSATHITPDSIAALMSCYVTRGDTLVARLRAEMAEQDLVPTSVEEEHLATAKDLADRIARLQAMVARDGESRKLKDGRIVLHPALAEIRQCESVLTRVVANIQTMETPQPNAKKQKAANTRWRATQLAAVERGRKAEDRYGS